MDALVPIGLQAPIVRMFDGPLIFLVCILVVLALASGLLALAVGGFRPIVSLGRMAMRLIRMLLRGGMITFVVVLGGSPMRLGSTLVMFGSLVVSGLRHA